MCRPRLLRKCRVIAYCVYVDLDDVLWEIRLQATKCSHSSVCCSVEQSGEGPDAESESVLALKTGRLHLRSVGMESGNTSERRSICSSLCILGKKNGGYHFHGGYSEDGQQDRQPLWI